MKKKCFYQLSENIISSMNPTNNNTISTTTTTTTTGLFKLIERFPSVEIFDWSNLEKTTSRAEAIAFIQKHVPKDSLCVLVYKEAYGSRERVWKYVRAHLAAEFNVLIITPTKGVLSENGSDDTHGEFDDYSMLTLLTLLHTRATLYSHDNYRFRLDEQLQFSRIYMQTAFWEAGGKIRDEYCTDLKQDATLYLDINIAPITQDQIPSISGSMIPLYRYSFQIPTAAGSLAVSMPTSPTTPPATPTTQPMLTSPTTPPARATTQPTTLPTPTTYEEYDEDYDDPPPYIKIKYEEFDDDFSPIDACPNNCRKCRVCKNAFNKRSRKKCKYSR